MAEYFIPALAHLLERLLEPAEEPHETTFLG